MQLNNINYLSLLVALELSVELSADYLQKGIQLIPVPVVKKTVTDGLICITLMTTIVALMLIIEPKAVENTVLAVVKQSKKILLKLRIKRKPKTTV